MAKSSPPASSRWFDSGIAWRFAVALLGALVAVPLIATGVGIIVGVPLLLLACRPLKDYLAKEAKERREQCTPKRK